jgi:tricorn protease
MVDRIPAQEWEQIFHEVWRRFRDFFYVENMHGYDWEALREQYAQQLEHVAHRSDLNYVLGEMVAELTVSHAYIQGGDWETPDRARVALLGARFELDDGSGRYRIAQIYRGQNDEERYRVPLTELGVNVSVGDYILAINGQDLIAPENPYRLLRHKAGHPITLTVNDRPTMSGAREVTVNPRTSENSLQYFTLIAERRDHVTQQTNGRVGYLHLPDMGSNGIREFIKWYYGQIRKEGLIVDVRGNGGGNVSQMVIDRLRRELLGLGFSRTFEWPSTYPGSVFTGHMVALINATSASDGDIFPWMFREADLGPLIGKRTWGGVIGISGRGPLIDGGNVFVPQYGQNGVDGSWVMENHGVEPDIEVTNTPTSLVQGRDLQLDRGIAEVMQKIEAEPVGFPQRPAPPVKTKP